METNQTFFFLNLHGNILDQLVQKPKRKITTEKTFTGSLNCKKCVLCCHLWPSGVCTLCVFWVGCRDTDKRRCTLSSGSQRLHPSWLSMLIAPCYYLSAKKSGGWMGSACPSVRRSSQVIQYCPTHTHILIPHSRTQNVATCLLLHVAL